MSAALFLFPGGMLCFVLMLARWLLIGSGWVRGFLLLWLGCWDVDGLGFDIMKRIYGQMHKGLSGGGPVGDWLIHVEPILVLVGTGFKIAVWLGLVYSAHHFIVKFW